MALWCKETGQPHHVIDRVLPEYSGLAPEASLTKEVNPQLAKSPLKTMGRLANRGLTSLVKDDT